MIVYLGLGSNLGHREGNLTCAFNLLASEVRILQMSSIYETVPLGYTEQPKFLNAALELNTSLSPQALLDFVKEVELEIGRQRSCLNGPRLIDIDILLYGHLIIEESRLQIPHPRLHERAFVLVPMAELAPMLVHPSFKLSMAVLLEEVGGKDGVRLQTPSSSIIMPGRDEKK